MRQRTADGDADPVVSWQRQHLDETVGCSCAGCNNGWMSKLELAFKPIAERLFELDPIALCEHDLAIIARWAMKTAVVALVSLRDPRGSIPSRTAAAVMNGLPTPGTTVHLGTRSGAFPNLGVEPASGDVFHGPGDTPVGRIFMATIVVLPLVLQVAHIDPPEAPSPLRNAGDKLVLISPSAPTTLAWPRDVALSGADLDALSVGG
jgi:hypothetical protein